MESQPRIRITGQLILGVAIAAAGLLFTLDNLHILRARDYLQYWPVVLVAIGLVHVAQAKSAPGIVGGSIWILVGGVMLGSRLGFLDVNVWNLWPLILVLVGGRIVWQTVSRDASVDRGADPSSKISAIAVMGGFDRKITSKEFRGGELTAFMGGGKLDLREAAPIEGQVVLNVFALMGGFEILMPDTWSLIIEATPFMGGIDDKTRTPANPSAPRLVLRGFVMMGGVDIKN
jgi:hypothetical protein